VIKEPLNSAPSTTPKGIPATMRQKDRRVVDLKHGLRVFELGPIEQTAATDVADGGEFLFGAL
jgi:hypothetical protein